MKSIINNIIDLWDPYRIYMFPSDEYSSYAEKISDFIKSKRTIDVKGLATYTYEILPPIEKTELEFIALIEYERFAKAIISILEKNKI